VHLAKNEQFKESYATVSASRLVPLLVDGEHSLTQSMAIIEYLDETHPQPPLLPGSAVDRARIRALAQDIACEIHPLNNLRVLRWTRTGGTGTGWRLAWKWWSAAWRPSPRPTAMVTPPRWPIACWCPRSSTPAASMPAWTTCPT